MTVRASFKGSSPSSNLQYHHFRHSDGFASSVPWLDSVTDLSVFVSTPSGVLGPATGPGTESTTVGPGMIYVHWFGDASEPTILACMG